MDVLRTPDSRFENLEDYPFSANYVDVAASDTQPLRMHYLDEGPSDGPPIVLLHGEPTWSYLYRKMIPPLADGGYRVLAPDLIGFGRSDKPRRIEDYTYLRHVEWVTSWFERLKLKDVTLVVQDWGSLIGLRIAAEQDARVGRLVVANGFLPTAQGRTPRAFLVWRTFARYSPVLPAGRLVATLTVRRVRAKVRAGYDAPFPDKRYQAGARAFPRLVPTSPDDPAVPANRAAWDALGRWEKPCLAIFGQRDPTPRKSGPPPDQAHPGRRRPAARPHQRQPLHSGGQRARIGRSHSRLAATGP